MQTTQGPGRGKGRRIGEDVWNSVLADQDAEASAIAKRLGVTVTAVYSQMEKRGRSRILRNALPSQSAVGECVLRSVCYYEAKTFEEILWDVLNDYGSLSRRALHRHIARLLNEGVITRLRDPLDPSIRGYLRTRRR